MENTPTRPDMPEAIRIDYAPPPARAAGWWWRVLVAVFSTICLGVGCGSMAMAAMAPSSYDRVPFAGLGVGFLAAGIGLPVMIFVAKRL